MQKTFEKVKHIHFQTFILNFIANRPYKLKEREALRIISLKDRIQTLIYKLFNIIIINKRRIAVKVLLK